MGQQKLVDLDKFDRAILNVVQTDAGTPLREIAERVNLSTAAVQRRLQRLADTGVVTAKVAVVNPAMVQKPITVLVEVQIEKADNVRLKALKAKFSGPEIQQCYYVTGQADFVLLLTVETMEEFQQIAQRLFYDDADVKWFRTIVVMDRVKVGLTVPIT